MLNKVHVNYIFKNLLGYHDLKTHFDYSNMSNSRLLF